MPSPAVRDAVTVRGERGTQVKGPSAEQRACCSGQEQERAAHAEGGTRRDAKH